MVEFKVLLKMATSDHLSVIQDDKTITEPQTAVSLSFGLISVVHFGGEFEGLSTTYKSITSEILVVKSN